MIPKGHQMSMRDALHGVSTGIFVKLILPDWSLKLAKQLQTIRLAFEELQVRFNIVFLNVIIPIYMSAMIEERKGSEKVQRHDLFGNLIGANDENLDVANDEIKGTFDISCSDQNLIPRYFEGNIYIFMLAGHEVYWLLGSIKIH